MPFIIYAIFIPIIQLIKSKTQNSFMARFDNVFLTRKGVEILLVFWFPLVRAVSSVLLCRTITFNDKPLFLLSEYPDAVCLSLDHNIVISVISIFLIAPIFTALAYLVRVLYVRKRDNILNDSSILSVFSKSYKKEYYFWLVIELIQRGTIGILVTFFRYLEVDFAWAIFIAIVFMLILHQSNAFQSGFPF